MRHKFVAIAAGITVAAAGGGAAMASGGDSTDGSTAPAPPSRLDDGKALLPQAQITEQQAIAAAQGAASGKLNEVDLEYAAGRLVFNVDVGSRDVQVDAATGDVVASNADD